MKKRLSLFLLTIILLSFSTESYAVNSVPGSVINSTKSTFRIFSTDGYSIYSGSCFVISRDYSYTFFATNYHVVEDTNEVALWIGENFVDAKIEAYRPDKDLCIVSIKNSDVDVHLSPLYLTPNVSQGEAVYAIGFPSDADYFSDSVSHLSSETTITDGIVSSLREFTIKSGGSTVKLIQTNANINHGNSGGPLLNKSGEVVGINSFGISSGIYGAVCSEELIQLAKDNGISIFNPSVRYIIIAFVVLTAFGVLLFLFKNKKLPNNLKQSKISSIIANIVPSKLLSKNSYVQIPIVRSLSTQHNGKCVKLSSIPIFIGRSSNCAFIFSSMTPGVSAIHCKVTYINDHFEITDLNSSYGTFLVTGERIHPMIQYKLKPNTVFYLGTKNNSFIVEYTN